MFLLDLLAVCFGFRLPFHNLEPFHLLRTEICLFGQSKIKYVEIPFLSTFGSPSGLTCP